MKISPSGRSSAFLKCGWKKKNFFPCRWVVAEKGGKVLRQPCEKPFTKDIVNLLLDFIREAIRENVIREDIHEGLKLSNDLGLLYFPLDLIELVIEFAVY